MAKQIIDGFILRDNVFNITPSASFFAARQLKEQIPFEETDDSKDTDQEVSDQGSQVPEKSEEPESNTQELPPETIETTDEESQSAKKDNNDDKKISKQPKPKFKLPDLKQHKIIAIVGGVIILLTLLILGGWGHFRSKALPSTYLMGQNVSGYNAQKLTNFISTKEQDFKLEISGPKQKLTPKKQDIGLSFDNQKTIDHVMSAHRSGNMWSHVDWWHRTDVDLSTTLDQAKFSKYLTTNISAAIVKPQNARVVFDTTSQSFVLAPDKPGSGILVDRAVNQITNQAQKGQDIDLTVSTEPTQADIRTSNLSQTLITANSYLKTNLSLLASQSNVSPTSAQRASWLAFTANKANSYDVSVNEKSIEDYVANLSIQLHSDMQPELTIEMKDGTKGGVLQAGQNGQAVINQAQIIAALGQAFENKQTYSGQVELATTHFTTQNMTAYPKWIYVSLSQQRLTAYEYAKPVYSFLISSGVAGHDTEIGVFHVWYKTPVQTMKGGSLASGDYYDLPNVHWDTYFDGQEAIHEAYWHHNFGHPMSHGCLNATYNDSQWVYKWAPVGTTVVVQN